MKREASVTWVSHQDGGRDALPDGNRYVTIARFPEDGPQWPDGAWSVVLDFDVAPVDQGSPSRGSASFLMDTAPQDRLRSGARFELCEGRRKVADVRIL